MTLLRREGTPRLGEEELRRIEGELMHALSEIRFGSIEIVIQDSRVVQIERREKVRFDRQAGGSR
ncbi:MAG TPA: YezD family protein [Thermoanaerobaculia bacterium]|nr:YezD family protein [Thermoanaerobaculia bacterium]